MAASLITRIILKGQTDPSLKKAFDNASKASDGSLQKLQKYGQTAVKAMKIVGTAVAAGLGASAKAAVDYESAFAGVKKTVDETDTTSYEDISNAIRNMAKNMPATTTEIAGVAEAAGQLGIKADDIAKFTEVMVNLGTTTNLSSEEAATSIAKMFNITGTSMDNVDRFGATIVALGNNAATTESDIVNMATRIASSGNQIGLTEQQILALSTSLSSVGLEAEGGGTAISTVMSQIDKSVAMSSDDLATWASTAGMSAAEFKTAWEGDAYGALQRVIQGMGDTNTNGGNLNILLDKLGITGIRTSDTMKRLSSASGLMSNMTDLANKAWDENVALTNEANTRYATVASQVQIFKNRLYDLGITVGQALMPYINQLMEKLMNIDFDAVGEKIVAVIDKVVNVFKYLGEHSQTVMTILSTLAGLFIGFKIGAFITTVIKAVLFISKLAKTFGLLKVVIAALGGPITVVIAIIGALVGAFIYLWNTSEGFRNFWIGLWDKIKSAASKAGAWLKNFFTKTLPKAFNSALKFMKKLPGKFMAFIRPIGEAIVDGFNTAVSFIKGLPGKVWTWLLGVISKVKTWGSQMIAKAKETGSKFLQKVIEFFKKLPYRIGYALGYAIGTIARWGLNIINWAKTNIPIFINTVITFFKQLPGKVWTWLTNVVRKVVAWGTRMITTGKTKATQFINGVISFVKQLPGKVWTWLSNTVSKVISWGARMISMGRQKATSFVNAVISFVRTMPGKIWTWLSNAVSKVIAWGARMISLGRQKATAFVNAVINFVKTMPGKIWTWLSNAAGKVVQWGIDLAKKGKEAATKLFNAVVNKVKEIPGKMASIGHDIVNGIWNGISGAAGWLKDQIGGFASGVLDGIKDAFKIGSPSKITTEYGVFIDQGLANGILKARTLVDKSVGKLKHTVTSGFSKVAPVIQPVMGKMKGALPKFGNGGTVTSPQGAIIGDKPETIVPHGNTPRNRSLLGEAAKGVGASMGGGSTTLNVTFAPVINGGNAEENRKMLLEEEEAFERKMDEYFAKKGRLAFA